MNVERTHMLATSHNVINAGAIVFIQFCGGSTPRSKINSNDVTGVCVCVCDVYGRGYT